MADIGLHTQSIDFTDLETRFGRANAMVILRTLEQFEGVPEERVAKLPIEERFKNVMRVMKDNMRSQTRH